MPPLNVDLFNPNDNSWLRVGRVLPRQNPGSFSQHTPDGSRGRIFFDCLPNDEESVIYKAESALETTILAGNAGKIFLLAGVEQIAILKDGESHTMSIKIDADGPTGLWRFTHSKER